MASPSVTPRKLQALTLLNDPVFVEASRALAKRVMDQAGPGAADRAKLAFRLCTGRIPKPGELNSILDNYEQQRKHFEGVSKAAAQLDAGLEARGSSVDTAAWIMISNSLLSLDETVTKE